MINAVIFDMDGLMVDSEPIWAATWEPAFALHGLTVKPGLPEACKGSSHDGVVVRVREAYDNDPEAIAAVDDFFSLAAQTLMSEGAPKKPGLDELLALLNEWGTPCAVASSSPRRQIEAVLDHADVLESISAIVGGDEGLPSKPAPDIFLAAARKLGADPATTLVLEDSFSGIRAAHAGGFVSVMVPDGLQPDDELRSLCAYVCDTLLDVRDLLAAGKL